MSRAPSIFFCSVFAGASGELSAPASVQWGICVDYEFVAYIISAEYLCWFHLSALTSFTAQMC